MAKPSNPNNSHSQVQNKRPPPPPPPKKTISTPTKPYAKPSTVSWADKPIDDDTIFDNVICSIPNVKNGTAAGGYIHDPDFKQFVTTQLKSISDTLTDLC